MTSVLSLEFEKYVDFVRLISQRPDVVLDNEEKLKLYALYLRILSCLQMTP